MNHDNAMWRRSLNAGVQALLVILISVSAAADTDHPAAPTPFAGTFSNDKLTVVLSASGHDYVGTISLGGNSFPATATANDQGLTGVFTASGKQFSFTATLANDQLTLISGGQTHTLARGAANPPTVPAASPAGTIIMRRNMIFDPIMRTNAFSILVPESWKLDSNISWAQIKVVPFVTISVSNPALRAEWHRYPRGFYVDGVRENYIRAYPAGRAEAEERFAEGKTVPLGETIHKLPATPRAFLEQILIPASCPDIAADKSARVTAVTDMPDVAKTQTDHDMLHRPCQVNRVRFAYNTPDGPMEREFICTMAVSDLRDKSGRLTLGPNYMYVTETTSRTAPSGKLDALLPTLIAIESSVTQQLPWFNLQITLGEQALRQQQQMLAAEMQKQKDRIAAEGKMLQDQRDAINERQRIMHDAAVQQSNDVSDRIQKNFANQQAAKADGQERFMHYITDTGKYKDPNDGSMITLPNTQYQYENNHGDIIGTNDPTYRPPIDPSTSWQQMEKVN
jgi:hypothetical protein